MTAPKQLDLKVGETAAYWTHGVDAFPGPVAQFRMAQLIDLDDRLYENARVVYRFLIGWYHEDYGDALLSMRHVSKVMRQRAPAGARILSHSVVGRAMVTLLETGWVARTHRGRGKGKGASRYVPVINVLDLAAQGKFPELSHSIGTDEPSHSGGTVMSHSSGTVDAEPSHSSGIKTHLPDPATETGTGKVTVDVSANSAAAGAPLVAGFEGAWKAYRRHGNKEAARVAFLAIAKPNVALITERAGSWAASAKPGTRRMPFERWLAAEKYDEADRKPANDNAKPAMVKITESTSGDGALVLTMKPLNGGPEFQYVVPHGSPELDRLEKAIGLSKFWHEDDFVFEEVEMPTQAA